MENNLDNLCPCCSGEKFELCCQPIVNGKNLASTPLALMRSRYTAHAMKNIPHIVRTMIDSNSLQPNLLQEMREDFDECIWTKLEIIDAPQISNDATSGIVEFKAHYTLNGVSDVLHDRSKFLKINHQWYYVYDNLVVQKNPKIGRNDLCSCGSGKKYKKCCLV